MWTGLFMQPSRWRICSSASACGNRLCLGRRIFFRKQRPVAAEGVLVEKLNGVMSDLEGSARDAAVTQFDQVRAHVRFAQFVGRAPVMGRQPANRLDVNVLAAGRQPCQGHVLDHPASQRGHQHLLRFGIGRAHRPSRAKRYSQLIRSAMPRSPRRSRSVQQRNFAGWKNSERRPVGRGIAGIVRPRSGAQFAANTCSRRRERISACAWNPRREVCYCVAGYDFRAVAARRDDADR